VITPEDGHRRCQKHVEFRDKINFGYLMHLVGYFIQKLFLASTLRPCCSTAVVHLADGVATICACRCGHKNNYQDERLHVGDFLGPGRLNDLIVGTVDRGFAVQSFRIMCLQ
jgi:hypothetical protein